MHGNCTWTCWSCHTKLISYKHDLNRGCNRIDRLRKIWIIPDYMTNIAILFSIMLKFKSVDCIFHHWLLVGCPAAHQSEARLEVKKSYNIDSILENLSTRLNWNYVTVLWYTHLASICERAINCELPMMGHFPIAKTHVSGLFTQFISVLACYARITDRIRSIFVIYFHKWLSPKEYSLI